MMNTPSSVASLNPNAEFVKNLQGFSAKEIRTLLAQVQQEIAQQDDTAHETILDARQSEKEGNKLKEAEDIAAFFKKAARILTKVSDEINARLYAEHPRDVKALKQLNGLCDYSKGRNADASKEINVYIRNAETSLSKDDDMNKKIERNMKRMTFVVGFPVGLGTLSKFAFPSRPVIAALVATASFCIAMPFAYPLEIKTISNFARKASKALVVVGGVSLLSLAPDDLRPQREPMQIERKGGILKLAF
jgi:hypothetical protein